MRYAITTNGQTYQRTREDNDSRLRIFNIGDYPVEVAINGGSYSEPFYRNQSFDISITKTPVTIRSIGGNSEVRTYRVYCSNVDECDIEGYFEPLTVESYESLIAKNAVLKSDIAQNLTNPTEVDVPSTKAVVATLTEFMSSFGSPLRYKGSVKTYSDLPTSDRVVGDMYNVEEPSDDYVAGTNFAWTGEVWDALGGTLSVLPSAITKFNAVVTKAVEDFTKLAYTRETELTEIYERAVLAISGDGGLVDTAETTLQSYVDQGYEYVVDTHSNLEQVKTLASEVEDDKRQVEALEQSVRANATEVRKLKEDLGDISSAVKTATTAEANVRALESSAWLAANRAEEISDPEGRISSLQLTKSNQGELWFNGGFAKVSNMSMNGSWSLCCRIRMQASQVQYASIFHLGAFYLYWNTRLGIYCSPAISSVKQISVDDNNRLANGEWHSLVVSYDGTTLKLTDETGVLLSVATSEQISISGNLLIGESNYNGQIADVKYFDFDMSSDDAPYTITDYISGKDESPLLQTAQPVIDWHILSGNTQSTTQTKGQSGILELNRTEGSYPRIFENGTFKVGCTYYIRLSGQVLFPSGQTGVSLRLKLPTSTAEITNNLTGEVVVSTPSNFQYVFGQGDGSEFDGTIKFIPTKTNDDDNCLFYFNPIEPNSNSYVNVSVRCDSVLLSLDDYAFNGKVFDTSGKNNTATITGEVKGTRDNAVEQMYQAFASRIQNVTTE